MGRRFRDSQAACAATSLLALVWLLACGAGCRPRLSAETIEKMRKTKAPEDWTIEDRLAVRFDPGDMQRREAAHTQEVETVFHQKPPAPPPGVKREDQSIIIGRHHPELFLPIELFDSLVEAAFLPDRQERAAYRQEVERRLVSAGLDPRSFWPALETIAREPIRLRSEFSEIALKLNKAAPEERQALNQRLQEIDTALCGPQAVALAETEERFGHQRVDRFLYRAVAPQGELGEPARAVWEQRLRAREAGCRTASLAPLGEDFQKAYRATTRLIMLRRASLHAIVSP